MALDAILTVASLAAGATVTMSHGISDGSGPLLPTLIHPDRATPIGVQSASSTTVTFINNGNQTESAFFAVRRDHSVQQPGDKILYWTGTPISSFQLTAPQWTDLRIPLLAAPVYGLRPALLVQAANDGTVVPGYAASFAGTTTGGTIADFGDFASSFSVSFWLTTSYASSPSRYILDKASVLSVWMQSGSLRVKIDGFATQIVPGLSLGVKNNVTITVSEVGTVSTLKVYVNNNLNLNIAFAGALVGNTNVMGVMSTALLGSGLAGVLDELRFYQAVLTVADVAELWNSGGGTELELISTPTLLAGYHFDENTGHVCDNFEGTSLLDLDMTGNTWVAGLVGAPGTEGVFTQAFPPGEETGLVFSTEFGHDYLEGSDYDLHLHLTCPRLPANGSKLVFGVELQRCSIHQVWPATTTVYEVTIVPDSLGFPANTHLLIHDWCELSGAGMGISHSIRGRVYRKGTGVDAFPYAVWLDAVGLHYQINTLGSRTETAK